MTDITVLVKELRKRTGAGIMECKKALVETHGDVELAVDSIRKSGQIKSAKRAGCITTSGIIMVKIAQDNKYGIIAEINCETDFVVKNDSFKNFCEEVITTALNKRINDIKTLNSEFEEKRATLVAKISENIKIRRLGVLKGDMISSYLHGTRIGVIISATNVNKELIKQIAMHIAASRPEYIDINSVPFDIIAHERQIQLDIAMQSGKPREIAEKIVEGRMRKFTDEISLTNQNFVIDPSKTVGQLLNEYNAKVHDFIRFEVGEGFEKTARNFAAEVGAINKNF